MLTVSRNGHMNSNIVKMVSALNATAAKLSETAPNLKTTEVFSFIAEAFDADSGTAGHAALRRMLANAGTSRAVDIAKSAACNLITIDADSMAKEDYTHTVMTEIFRLHRYYGK